MHGSVQILSVVFQGSAVFGNGALQLVCISGTASPTGCFLPRVLLGAGPLHCHARIRVHLPGSTVSAEVDEDSCDPVGQFLNPVNVVPRALARASTWWRASERFPLRWGMSEVPPPPILGGTAQARTVSVRR